MFDKSSEKLVKFLSGKKGVIASIVWVVTAYLAAEWTITQNDVILIWSLSTIFFWAASYETKKYYQTKKNK